MTALWSWPQLCEALDLTPQAGPDIHGISIDSRRVKTGDLFVALSGGNQSDATSADKPMRDGHEFSQAALDSGAVGVLAHKRVDCNAPVLSVANTLDALWQLARVRRTQLSGHVVAVTGSSGKTTLKTFLHQALGCFAAESSFNNHIGVPLSLARTPSTCQLAVYEIGTNHPGEIEPLARLVAPNIAALLNVSTAHIGNFADIAQLTEEKLSIRCGLRDAGTFIVPESLVSQVNSGKHRIITHGESENASVSWRMNGSDAVQIRSSVASISRRVPGGGVHRAQTLACAGAVIHSLGLPLSRLAQVSNAPPTGRGNMVEVGGITLIDDSYNANPASMAGALSSLLTAVAKRRIAIVGTMAELGDESDRYHVELLPLLTQLDGVICVGAYMDEVYSRLPSKLRLAYFVSADALLQADCVSMLKRGDRVLIKASNALFWERDFVKRLATQLGEANQK